MSAHSLIPLRFHYILPNYIRHLVPHPHRPLQPHLRCRPQLPPPHRTTFLPVVAVTHFRLQHHRLLLQMTTDRSVLLHSQGDYLTDLLTVPTQVGPRCVLHPHTPDTAVVVSCTTELSHLLLLARLLRLLRDWHHPALRLL
jgi:hypothetical protein